MRLRNTRNRLRQEKRHALIDTLSHWRDSMRRDVKEQWTDITLSDALEILARRSLVQGLQSLVHIALDRDGVLLYLPTTSIENAAIGLPASSLLMTAVAA